MSTTTAEWTVLEKLLLAQAVYKFGEDNWFQIARNLKQHSMLDRQPDFFNQKNCSLQYYLLIESLETEKRQAKANASAQDMPPVVKLAKQLYTQRIDEIKQAIKVDDEKFLKLIGEIDEIRAGKWDSKLAEQIKPTSIEEKDSTTPTSTTEQRKQEQEQEQLANEKQPEKVRETSPQEASTSTTTTTLPSSPTNTTTDTAIVTDVQQQDTQMNPEETPNSETITADTPISTQTPETLRPKSDVASALTTIETSATPLGTSPLISDEEKGLTPVLSNKSVEPMEVDSISNNNNNNARGPDATMVPSVVDETMTPTQALQQEPHVTTQPTVSDSMITKDLPKLSSTPTMPGSPQSDTSYQSALESTIPTVPALSTPDVATERSSLSLLDESQQQQQPTEGEKRKYEDIEMIKPDQDDQIYKRQRLEEPGKEIKTEHNDDDEQVTAMGEEEEEDGEERAQTERLSEPKSPEAINAKSPELPLSMTSGGVGADAEGTESVTGSESNAPTPTSTSDKRKNKDEQRQQKSWQKNINLLWREIANHKNGAMFMNPIKEATAPLYYDVVKHPVDLKTIKNRIRDGVIKTTIEFERDIVLMLTNSLMYNKEGTEIYQMALEMLEDVNEQLKLFKTADSNSSTTVTHTRKASTVAKDRRKSVAE